MIACITASTVLVIIGLAILAAGVFIATGGLFLVLAALGEWNYERKHHRHE